MQGLNKSAPARTAAWSTPPVPRGAADGAVPSEAPQAQPAHPTPPVQPAQPAPRAALPPGVDSEGPLAPFPSAVSIEPEPITHQVWLAPQAPDAPFPARLPSPFMFAPEQRQRPAPAPARVEQEPILRHVWLAPQSEDAPFPAPLLSPFMLAPEQGQGRAPQHPAPPGPGRAADPAG